MYMLDDCQTQADYFYSVFYAIVNKHAPIEERTLKNNDKPWITVRFIELIEARNAAFKAGDRSNYNRLRNQVNRLRPFLQKTTIAGISNISRRETRTSGGRLLRISVVSNVKISQFLKILPFTTAP